MRVFSASAPSSDRGRAPFARGPRPTAARKAAPPIPLPAPDLSWRKATPVALEPDASVAAALARIAAACLAHLRDNEACLLARAHAEGAHQMRVALRRLRSVLRLFADALPEGQKTYFARESKWILDRLAGARDWDVFCDEILRPVAGRHRNDAAFRVLHERSAKARAQAYVEAEAAVRSPRYVRFVARLAAWTEDDAPLPRDGDARELAVKPVGAAARKLIGKRQRKIAAAERGPSEMSAAERHRLRIKIKRLRYAVDMLGSLFPRRRVERWLNVLADIQDALGQINDVAVGRRLLARLTADSGSARAAERRYAAGLVVGWHDHRIGKRDKDLKKAWRRFVALPSL